VQAKLSGQARDRKDGAPAQNGIAEIDDTATLKAENPYTKYYQQQPQSVMIHGQVCAPQHLNNTTIADLVSRPPLPPSTKQLFALYSQNFAMPPPLPHISQG
jgi:hypothetical protein